MYFLNKSTWWMSYCTQYPQWILYVLSFGGTILLFFIGYFSIGYIFDSLQAQYQLQKKGLLERYESAKQQEKILHELQKQQSDTQKTFENLKSNTITAERQRSYIFSTLHDIGISLTNFAFITETPKPLYTKQQITCSFDADFFALMTFLKNLKNAKKYIQNKTITITKKTSDMVHVLLLLDLLATHS